MKATRTNIVLASLMGLVLLGSGLQFVPQARAASGAVIVFLTRLNGVMSTYPANNAFNVGTSTPQGGAAKLGLSLNVTDTFGKAFEIASTTGTGTATTSADLLLVKNTGCIQATATSSATQIKLTFSTVATSTASGYVLWAYGTCP